MRSEVCEHKFRLESDCPHCVQVVTDSRPVLTTDRHIVQQLQYIQRKLKLMYYVDAERSLEDLINNLKGG